MTDRLAQSRLDELWDFADAAESETRFRAEIAATEPHSVIAAELTTQLARAVALQERYAEADAVLDGIASGDAVVLARSLLERGRVQNSSGHPDAAIPLFEEALAAAAAAGDDFLAIDAAHMLAIADGARAAHWTARGLETVAETKDARTKRWAVSLHNNVGWNLFEGGHPNEALAEFELAADAAVRFGTADQQRWAKEAIDEVLEALGRA